MSEIAQSAENAKTSERRVHPRKHLSFLHIQLGNDNGGAALDISEGGLGIEPVKSLIYGQLPRMRFQLSESQAWIETRGRVVWMNPSRKRAGVEFVDLPERARNQIKDWAPVTLDPGGFAEAKSVDEKIEPAKDLPETVVPGSETIAHVVENQSQSTERSTAVLSDAIKESSAGRISDASGEETKSFPSEHTGYRLSSPVALSYGKKYRRQIGSPETTVGSRKAGRIGVGLVTALLLSTCAFFLVFHFRSRAIASNRQPRELLATATKPGSPPKDSGNPTRPSVEVKFPVDMSGFVLQVGAMKQEENADALVASLKAKSFPAFSYQRGSDDFHRVVVGPYQDAESATEVQKELRKQGFDAIRTQWNPAPSNHQNH